jgi:hypothetical protein
MSDAGVEELLLAVPYHCHCWQLFQLLPLLLLLLLLKLRCQCCT